MKQGFYFKLAFTNLKRNRLTYIPYILAGIGTVFTFFTLVNISKNKGFQVMPGADSLQAILLLGSMVVGIFGTAFLFYANSFLMKRRKKELGLYGILGLEKKHVGRVLLYETLLCALTSIVCGLLLGSIFSRLSFLILLNIMNAPKIVPTLMEVDAFIQTVILFSVIFFINWIYNRIQLKIANPINLLRSEEQGEKIPRTKILMTLIGLAALGGGYYIAVTVKSPIKALPLFFLAVLLVIIGTFTLFTAGSIALLKILKSNKTYFYRPKNFVAVSGMIFRMKQNASGLANICILSTMVLVMMSGSISLYAGQESSLRNRYPFDITVTGRNQKLPLDKISEMVKETANRYDLKITKEYYYNSLLENVVLKDGFFKSDYGNRFSSLEDQFEKSYQLDFLVLDDYNRISESNLKLEKNEVYMFSVLGDYGKNTIKFGEQEYTIVQELSSFPLSKKKQQAVQKQLYIIVKDKKAIEQIQTELLKESNGNGSGLLQSVYVCDTNGTSEEKLEFADDIVAAIKNQYENIYIETLERNRNDWYANFGGLLFLGAFLGIVFMLATVLIIYFKQVSEGYQDRGRFNIMMKVGMGKDEVKKTIRKQILMVFFMPLLTAILHMVFAFPIICRLLSIFELGDTTFILICTICCIVIFSLAYVVIYTITARSYYKIVEA